MNKTAFCILLFLLLSIFVKAQTTIYITPNGAGVQNGTSWSNALSGASLRNTLRQSPAFTQIWVAAGTYKPYPSSRDSSFYIHSNVKIYGGFAGNETQLSQRNWITHPTILSGDIGLPNDTSDNSLHVVYFENAADSTILDGFTVVGGNASRDYSFPPLDRIGGGILNYSNANPGLSGISSPTIRNCTIQQNYAFEGGGGVAEMLFGTCNTRYVNCIFDNNFAYHNGGALAIQNALGGWYNPTFDSCIFRNNHLDTAVNSPILNQQGGAVALIIYQQSSAPSYGNPKFRNCLFDNNWARNAGAIVSGSKFNVTIENSIFRNNIARTTSAIYSNNSNYQIRNCLFEDNLSLQVGLVQLTASNNDNRTKNEISGCTFRNNKGIYSVYIRAMAPTVPSINSIDTTTITNCLFYHDSRDVAIMSEAASLGVTNTTINNVTVYADNDQATMIWEGGLIFNRAYYQPNDIYGPGVANITVNNSIMYYPLNWTFSTQFSRAFKSVATGLPGVIANATVHNSLIRAQNNAWPTDAGINGGGNLINTDPRFIDTAGHNFRLSCGSSLVNAGNTSLFPSGITTDIDGHPRVYGSSIDIGCYEQQMVPMPLSIPLVTATGFTVHCTASSNMAIDSVRWNFGSSNFSNQLNASYTYTTGGSKQICLTVYTACGSKDSCITINLSCPLPVPGFSYTTNGMVGNYTYTGSIPVDSVVWTFGDNWHGTGSVVSHTYATRGTYNVCATAYNNCGNDKVCKNVSIASTSVNAISESSVYIFPNPATDEVQVRGLSRETGYTLYSNIGAVVQQGVLTPDQHSIRVAGLSAGIYILGIQDKTGDHQHIRLIKY